MGLGLQFAATVGVFVALGLWADGRFGTQPWLLLLGSAVGFAGALLALVRAVPPARSRSTAPGSASPHPSTPPRPPKDP